MKTRDEQDNGSSRPMASPGGPWLVEEAIDLSALLSETEDPSCGAVVVFGGTVRDVNEGRPVISMAYEAHRTLAQRAIHAIERETTARDGVRRCRIVHRTGHLELGELSVAIVVRAPHRVAAIDAARWAIDEIKQRVPIWKEEHYADGDARHLDGVRIAGAPTIDGRKPTRSANPKKKR